MNENNSNNDVKREVIFSETYSYAGKDNQRMSETIDYPAPKEDIARLLANAGIDGSERRTFYSETWASVIPGIYNKMPESINLDELNYLALQIQALDDGQRNIYAAAVEAGRHCRRMDELINLTANIVNFKLLPSDKQTNKEPGEQGRRVLEGADGSTVPGSAGSAQRNFRAETAGGVQTSRGFLIESGTFQEPYRWVGDIPPEQRATEYLDKYTVPAPADIVRGVDLSVMTLQLHAVCGDYMADAPDSLATLEALRSAEHLLLFDERGAFLTAAAHAYREGTPAYDRFMSAANTPETQVFALHITDIWTETEGEPERGPIIGDIVSVNLRDQQWDIQFNTVYPKFIDGERHFEHEDYQAVHRHVERVSNHHQDNENYEPSELGDFLLVLNRPYMAKAEYPQDDKIRIAQSAAKEMLARNDADVYRLKAGGAETLPSIAVVHNGLNFEKERAFAIKHSNLAGLNTWAKRAASEMTRQAQERGEQKKNRGNEI